MLKNEAAGNKFKPSALLHNTTLEVNRLVKSGQLRDALTQGFAAATPSGFVVRGRNTTGASVNCWTGVHITGLNSTQYLAAATSPKGMAATPIVDFATLDLSATSEHRQIGVTQQGAAAGEIVPIMVHGVTVVRVSAKSSASWATTTGFIPSTSVHGSFTAIDIGGFPLIAAPNDPSGLIGDFALMLLDRPTFSLFQVTLTQDLYEESASGPLIATATCYGVFGSSMGLSKTMLVRDPQRIFIGGTNGSKGWAFGAPQAFTDPILFQLSCP